MSFLTILILALVQGITEFLPISSSGHLVLVHQFLQDAQDWQTDLTMDVAVHVGTLGAVIVYFRKDMQTMLRGFWKFLTRKGGSEGTRLAKNLFVSSMPVVAAGFIVHMLSPSWLRMIETIGWATLIFGILLWVVDQKCKQGRTVESLSATDAAWIGMAQALALIPGTSRSGITMTAARALGLSRTEAAHYSLLLAIIAIAGAGTLAGIDLIQAGDPVLTFGAAVAAVLAFLSGWAAITLMMKFLENASFTVFAAYRVVLGTVLLALVYFGGLS